MATVENIKKYIAQRKSREVKEHKKNEFIQQQVWDLEQELIDEFQLYCPFKQGSAKDVKLDKKKVEKFLKTGYGDENILLALMCMNIDFLATLPSEQNISKRMQVKNLFKSGLEQVGDEGTDGVALSGNKYIIKASKSEGSQDGNHEFIVGAFGINYLRSFIPNFAYVLGYFKCSSPYLIEQFDSGDYEDLKGIAATYCQNNSSTIFVIYENVEKAELFYDFVQSCSLQDYCNVIIQLAYALQMAVDLIGFNHQDLHEKNVLIKKLDKPITIKYTFRGRTRFVNTNLVATIIDYGRARIDYIDHDRTYDLGTTIIDTADVPYFNDDFNSISDLFKIICSTLTIATNGDVDIPPQKSFINPKLTPVLKILDLFGIETNNYPVYLNKVGEFFFHVPKLSIQPFTVGDKIAEMFKINVEKSLHPLYGCSETNTCSSINDVLNEAKVSKWDPKTDNIYDWYTLYMSQDYNGKNLLLDSVKGKEKLFRDSLMREFKKLTMEIDNDYQIMKFKESDPLEYRFFADKTVNMATLYTDLTDLYKLAVFVENKQKIFEKEDFTEMKKILELPIFRKVWQGYDQIVKDYLNIRNFLGKEENKLYEPIMEKLLNMSNTIRKIDWTKPALKRK